MKTFLAVTLTAAIVGHFSAVAGLVAIGLVLGIVAGTWLEVRRHNVRRERA